MYKQSSECAYKAWIDRSLDTFCKLSEEDQEKAIVELISKCGIASTVRLSKFCYDFINQDFLVKLPLEVLEFVVNYLPVIDTLIACHASTQWNKLLSMLDFAWRKKWQDLYMDTSYESTEPKDSWKAECERGIALSRKVQDQTMLSVPEDFSTKLHITTMDYCDGILFCCGNPINSDSSSIIPKNIAHVYKRTDTWKLVTVFEVPVRFCVLCCYLIPGFKILAGGHDGILTIWTLEVPEKDQPGEVTLITAVQAHTSSVGSLCGDKDLGIAVSAGRDAKISIWNLETGARLKSFSTSRVCEVSLLPGNKSPFRGYNCILIRKSGERCTVAMACWGQNILLQDALYAPVVSHTHKYDYLLGPSTILPNVSIQDGCLVYGFRKYVTDLRTETCKLIWQPLDPDDFIHADTDLSSEELHKFRESLHPLRQERFISLPQDTIGIQSVGLTFSVIMCSNSPNLYLVVNKNGDIDKLLDVGMIFNRADEICKLGHTKWLDGINHIEPNTVCFIRVIRQEQILTLSWKDDVFSYNKPSLPDLLALRNQTSGLLARHATAPVVQEH